MITDNIILDVYMDALAVKSSKDVLLAALTTLFEQEIEFFRKELIGNNVVIEENDFVNCCIAALLCEYAVFKSMALGDKLKNVTSGMLYTTLKTFVEQHQPLNNLYQNIVQTKKLEDNELTFAIFFLEYFKQIHLMLPNLTEQKGNNEQQ